MENSTLDNKVARYIGTFTHWVTDEPFTPFNTVWPLQRIFSNINSKFLKKKERSTSPKQVGNFT